MPESTLKHVTPEQAWEVVHALEGGDGDRTLGQLDENAQGELAGLSAFGWSGNQPELLSMSVDPFLLTDHPRSWNAQHIRSALLRLGFSEPDE